VWLNWRGEEWRSIIQSFLSNCKVEEKGRKMHLKNPDQCSDEINWGVKGGQVDQAGLSYYIMKRYFRDERSRENSVIEVQNIQHPTS